MYTYIFIAMNFVFFTFLPLHCNWATNFPVQKEPVFCKTLDQSNVIKMKEYGGSILYYLIICQRGGGGDFRYGAASTKQMFQRWAYQNLINQQSLILEA